MPVSFQFENEAGEVMTLDAIDREMCEDTRYPFSDSQYCPMMIWVQLLGTALEGWPGGINPLNANIYMSNPETDYTNKERTLMVKYLCGKYQYRTWWGHK